MQDREQSSSQHLANIPDLYSFLQEDSDNLKTTYALCWVGVGFGCGVWLGLIVCFKQSAIYKVVSDNFTI